MGHYWKKKYIPTTNFSSVCDICGLAGSLLGDCVYYEFDCNIFICKPCYEELPWSEK